MDRIINYLLLTIIFVFDPLAIALVIAANFAFARLRKPTRENLYGETVECSVPEGKEFNTPYDIDDLIEKEPAEEFDDDSKTINDNRKQIQKLEAQKAKIQRNGGTAKRVGDALAQIQNQIKN